MPDSLVDVPRVIPKNSLRIGFRFGRFTLFWRSYAGRRWGVICDCGHERYHDTRQIVEGRVLCPLCDKDCELPKKVSRPEYKAWHNMIARCTHKHHALWSYYGARGIEVCGEWRVSYHAFITDMGPRPSNKHSLDRIDNDGNYEPGNCRWATAKQQARNQRKTYGAKYTFRGETLKISEWSKRLGVPSCTLTYRIKKWGVERALSGNRPRLALNPESGHVNPETIQRCADAIGLTYQGMKCRMKRMSIEQAMSIPRYVHASSLTA